MQLVKDSAEPLQKKTLNLNELFSFEKKKEDKPKELLNEPITQEQVEKVWADLATHFQQDAMAKLLFPSTVQVENTKITVLFQNTLQAQALLKHQEAILKKIRAQLKNDFVSLTCEVRASENTSTTPYTNREKWEWLTQKNPDLLYAKSALGLDYDL